MPADSPRNPGGRRLNTWKEIANFFGCDERTVKRWEASRGLPVRRLPNGSRSAVFAYENELRAWLHERDAAGADAVAADGVARASDPGSKQSDNAKRMRVLALAASLGALAIVALAIFYGSSSVTDGVFQRSHKPNPEALALYKEGLYAWQTRTPVGLARAVDDFTQAIVHDPQYAQAYAGLAGCYNLLREYTTMAPDYAFPRAKAAAERAVALDPKLGDAHAALAFVEFYGSRNIPRARSEFERAIALEPGNATAHHWYATLLLTIGEFPRAVAEIEKAESLDTESTAIRADKGIILFYAGHADEAVVRLRELELTAPLFASTHRYLAIVARAQGDDAAYLREFTAAADARHDEAERTVAEAGRKGLASGGHSAMLNAILAEQKRLFGEGAITAFALAQTYAELGDTGNALFYLRKSITRREMDSLTLGIEPTFARLRNRPDFHALLREAFAPVAFGKTRNAL